MKFRGIQRAVKPRRYERSAGDAPNLGRVGRVPGTGLPKKPLQRRRRRRGEGGGAQRKRVLMMWSVVWAVMVMGVVGAALWFWLRPAMNRGRAEGGVRAEASDARVVSRFESPSEREALGLVKRALAVRDPGGVGEYFHAGGSGPEGVVAFLAGMETSDGPVKEYSWLSSMDANGLLIDGVLVKTESGTGPRNRLALLTPDVKGVWKIDFEAFARTAVPPLDELLASDSAEGVARVIVATDSYFNGPFSDDTEWDCYGMASPDTEVVMLGYCRRGTPQAAAMAKILADGEDLASGGRSMRRATLKIRHHAGGERRQFEISRVMAQDWVMSAKAFDEGFQ
jgi:hypothetical protein